MDPRRGYLKQKNSSISIVAAEPEESAVLSGNQPGKHSIQGIGAGFIPSVLDTEVIDNIVKVPSAEAVKYAKIAALDEKILCGISSGAALYAAVVTARKNPGKNIVTVFPDGGERYLSTGLYDD